MEGKISQVNIAEIKRRRKDLIKKIRISLDILEVLEKQEENYRERKKILNLKQNQKSKEEKKLKKEEKKNNKYF